MPEAKTKPTDRSVDSYLAGITDPVRVADCQQLIDLMSRITGEPPVLWGPSIVGFGTYRYRMANGKPGASCVTGFSSRKPDISIYLVAEGSHQKRLLEKLGKHKMGKSCLSIRRLEDVDLAVLEQLIRESVTEIGQKFPD